MTDVAEIERLMAEVQAEFAMLDADLRGRKMVTGGRYRLPRRDGSKKPWGWMRATNLAGAISDQKSLTAWELRTQLWGIRAQHGIVQEFLDEPIETMDNPTEIRDTLDVYVKRLKAAGGGDLGSQRGTVRHAMVEAEHSGLPVHVTPRMHAQLDNYRSALADGGLIPVPGMQERTVLNERYEICGSLDNVLHDLNWNTYRIADLKTQRKFYAWLEIVIQLHLYATSDAILNKQTWTWEDWPIKIDPTTALVAWMPHEHPDEIRPHGVDIYEVEIWRGRKLADLALAVVRARSAAKSVKGPWGRVRTPAGQTAPLSERWARRAGEAGSMDELRAVAAGAKQAGVWEVVRSVAISREKALHVPEL